jgi:chromosome segregation ATPase
MTSIPTNMIHKDPAEPGVMEQLASGVDLLIAHLTEAEAERDAAIANAGQCATQYHRIDQRVEQLEARVDGIGSTGEQAMELLRKLGQEIDGLRCQLSAVEKPTTEDPGRPNFDMQKEAELQRTREELAEVKREAAEWRQKLEEVHYSSQSSQDPEAALRILEDQRDQARADAAGARADLSIQCAEVETKDALIVALERALEQQHTALRRLEERFAEYASRLHDLRLEKSGGKAPTAERTGAIAAFRSLFSPPKRLAAPAGASTSQRDQEDEED